MTFDFDPYADVILVTATVCGPGGQSRVLLMLDTGANVSAIDPSILLEIGIDPARDAVDEMPAATASGITSLPIVRLKRLSALGQMISDILVFAHAVPKHSGARGLLGLDFLRGKRLVIDMRKGVIDLR